MGLIITILLGALVGYVAARLLGRREGFIASTVIGIIGAIIGNVISRSLDQGNQSYLAFSVSGLLWALGGSVVVVVLLNLFQNRGTTPRI